MSSQKKLLHSVRSSGEFVYEAFAPHSKLKISVRLARKDELSTIIILENLAWPRDQRASEDKIKARFSTHPEGFFIAENVETKEPYGFVFLVPLSHFNEDEKQEWQKYSDLGVVPNIDEKSPYRYCVSLSIASGSPRGTATTIIKGAAKWCELSGIKKFAWGARIPKFRTAFLNGSNIEIYFQGILDGLVREEVVGAAIGAGGKIVRPLPDYYEDPESMNYGVLIVHTF